MKQEIQKVELTYCIRSHQTTVKICGGTVNQPEARYVHVIKTPSSQNTKSLSTAISSDWHYSMARDILRDEKCSTED